MGKSRRSKSSARKLILIFYGQNFNTVKSGSWQNKSMMMEVSTFSHKKFDADIYSFLTGIKTEKLDMHKIQCFINSSSD
jgi:hypothetical protein